MQRWHVSTVSGALDIQRCRPAGMYLRVQNKDKWVIWMMGGGWCWDQASCQSRMQTQPQLMSSKVYSHPSNSKLCADLDTDHCLRRAV